MSRPEILEVPAENLRLGDSLDEGVEIVMLHHHGDQVEAALNTPDDTKRTWAPGDLVRVARATEHRAGLAGQHHTTCIADAKALELDPSRALGPGDLRIHEIDPRSEP